MRRYPMIFEAFSGSKYLIFEKTTFVDSKASMAFWVFFLAFGFCFGFEVSLPLSLYLYLSHSQ